MVSEREKNEQIAKILNESYRKSGIKLEDLLSNNEQNRSSIYEQPDTEPLREVSKRITIRDNIILIASIVSSICAIIILILTINS